MRVLLRAMAVAGAVVLLLALAACPKKAGGGGPADFTGFDGKGVRLADYAGKPVVLNFWAVW